MNLRARIDRLEARYGLAEKEEFRFPDWSVLSPEDQDRFWGLLTASKHRDLTADELTELSRLSEACPLMRGNDAHACPPIEVPRALRMRFAHYHQGTSIKSRRFDLLRNVECVRFVELCTQYGWQEGTLPHDTMLPLSEWSPKDRSELERLLAIARGDYGNDPYQRGFRVERLK